MKHVRVAYYAGASALLLSPPLASVAIARPTIPTTSLQAAQNASDPARQRLTRAERRAARQQARRDAAAAKRARSAPRDVPSTVDGGDIIVTGLRQSVGKSIDRKRKARQIVDVVTAEDAGKLPDNNVVEAMARVTGITVTRGQGRANGFNIRGLAGVQTTINGIEGATAPLPGGEGRTIGLEAVPAELVKSIEVYKTRTADQIEGGIGGSVNIELRRPLDLKKGWTIAGGVRDAYAEQGKLWSPQANLLVGSRFDTGVGEIGFLLNGAYVKQRYAEAYNTSESPDLIGCATCRVRTSLPAAERGRLVAPYLARYATNDGEREQTSLSGVIQWRASSKLNFVLEGSYIGEDYSDRFSSLYVRLREDNYIISNPRVAASGVLLGFDITNPPLEPGTAPGPIIAGFEGGEDRGRQENYRTNVEGHFETDGLRIDGSAQYQWSNTSYHGIGHGGTYAGLSSVRVDLDSPKVLGNGPYFEFDASPTDADRARVTFLRDNIGTGENQQFSAQLDVWKELDSDGLLRAGKFGGRYALNTAYFEDSFRYAGYFSPRSRSLPFSSIPGASPVRVTPDLPGGSPLSWVQLNNRALYDNWSAITKFIQTSDYEFLDGPGRDAGAAALFAEPNPTSLNPVYTSRSREHIFAAYGTLDYAFTAHFPIDGNIGLRYVNTWSSLSGYNNRQGPAIVDTVTNLPTGDFEDDTTVETSVRTNYVDLLPSAFATLHFTRKLQLRASYSHNVQRPGLFSLRNYVQVNYRDPRDRVYAGNPDLKPTRTDDYNLSLEWYPAEGSILSLTAFRKDQTGFIYETAQVAPVAQLGGQNRLVVQPRNAGPGRTEGLEAQLTGFFRFLPGFLRNFGATVNATWIPTARVLLPAAVADTDPPAYELVEKRAPFTSLWTYNLIGYYETPSFSARLAYNWRSDFQTDVDAINETWIQSAYPQQRLDGAINYTPVKYLTLSIEGQNLLRNIDRYHYYKYPELPVGLRAMGRTISASARFRF